MADQAQAKGRGDPPRARRRSQGRAPRSTDRMRRPELAARWAASLALKRAGVLPDRLTAFTRDFTPAPDGVNGVRALDAGA